MTLWIEKKTAHCILEVSWHFLGMALGRLVTARLGAESGAGMGL